MSSSSVVFSIFVVFAGAAVLATAALFARQAMIVAYIVVGVAFGPAGFGLVKDAQWLDEVAKIGIMFLLYLLGLNMVPSQLWKMLREAMTVTGLSSVIFFAFGAATGLTFGFTSTEAVVIGAAMMFSSTIIGLKLLPTTALHHQHTGQVMISVLLLQDLLAIIVLLALQGQTNAEGPWGGFALELVALPLLLVTAYALEHWVLEPLLVRFDQIQEYMFLLVIAWCLSLAEFANRLGLSHEIGAFIAGVALANCPAALFIADSLRPLRDFFLILFFFSLGASLDLAVVDTVLWPSACLALGVLVLKPLVFRFLLLRAGETEKLAREAGVRLGQVSEFSLLVAVLAVEVGALSARASFVVQLATMISFVASSYLIVMRYPTPIAVRDSLRQD
ncbi:MAG: cation:proton antiporter [Gammaproteobacteria bacterium]|nr:cation:proton antiporter [Gammaproteobacteria bacterium]